MILHLHDVGCVRLGDFVMASGLPSPIYIDLRRVMSLNKPAVRVRYELEEVGTPQLPGILAKLL